MSRDLKRILIILFLLALVISPVAAQDDDETTEEPVGVTVTIPGDGDESGGEEGRTPPWELIAVVVLVIAVLGYSAFESRSKQKLHLELADFLFRSTPAIVRGPALDFASGIGDNVVAELDRIAKSTDWTNLDDQAHKRVDQYFAEMKARWQELQQGFTPSLVAQSDPAFNRMSAIAEAQTLLSSEGWTLTPPGGYDAEWLERDRETGTDWKGQSGEWQPGANSIQPGDSYPQDNGDTDFLQQPPQG